MIDPRKIQPSSASRTHGLGHYPLPPGPGKPPIELDAYRRRGLRQRLGWKGLSLVLLFLVVALAAGLLFNTARGSGAAMTQRDVNVLIANALASVTPAPPVAAMVYDAIAPSVVLIHTHIDKSGEIEDGAGSGTIIDDTGSILTCLHVIAGATEIEVIFADGSRSPATVTATLPDKDIAVLSPSKPPLPVIPAVMGSPSMLRPGDDAIVVGNPFGMRHSVTSGIISGLSRTFTLPGSDVVVPGLIQFDAAVNPGNSGGPLLNRDGELVGVVIGLANPTDQTFFVGIGFAVPIDEAAAAGGPLPF